MGSSKCLRKRRSTRRVIRYAQFFLLGEVRTNQNEQDVIPVVLLDEVGLAEISKYVGSLN